MNEIEEHICRECKRKFLTRDKNKLFCNVACEETYMERVALLRRRALHRLKMIKWRQTN